MTDKQKDILGVDERTESIQDAFRELMKDRAFVGALDALSADVLDACDGFFQTHAVKLLKQCRSASEADVISAVCGWILGMPAAHFSEEENARMHEVGRNLMLAAYIAPFSAQIGARAIRKSTH